MEETKYKKGLWTAEEDKILMDYVRVQGKGRWNRIPKTTGLRRCGRSCRLRWMNYLCPNVKRGNFTKEEDDLIIRLHKLLGNRWSLIAGRVPGRTDNQVKNHWNTRLRKKLGIRKDSSTARDAGDGEENLKLPKDLDSGDGGPHGPQQNDGPHKAIMVSHPEGSWIDKHPSTSVWFYQDNLIIDNSSLMDGLDGNPLDMIWHQF